MTKHPILFSGPMVRAILAGRKTQTRRLCHPMAGFPRQDGEHIPGNGSSLWTDWGPCPHGRPGDRLWVREIWAPIRTSCDEEGGETWGIRYAADDALRPVLPPEEWKEKELAKGPLAVGERKHWRPSIFMSRWASRLSLGLTAVRVERLQDITAEDARAEGIEVSRCQCEVCARSPSTICPADASEYVSAYRALWDSINGKRPGASWAANPWVWVESFTPVLP